MDMSQVMRPIQEFSDQENKSETLHQRSIPNQLDISQMAQEEMDISCKISFSLILLALATAVSNHPNRSQNTSAIS